MTTDDGRVIAISQILYSQYHIWDISVINVLVLKTKVFGRKRQPNQFSHGQGTNSAKIVLIVWPKIPQMPQNLSAQFDCTSSKVWDIIEKKGFIWRPWFVASTIVFFTYFALLCWKRQNLNHLTAQARQNLVK